MDALEWLQNLDRVVVQRDSRKSNGPWLLIMDNCSGHESEIALQGLRIELLPPRSTSKHQPIDLGLIAHSNIRCRSNLLRTTNIVMLESQSGARDFPSSSQQGIYSVRDGFSPPLVTLWRYLMNHACYITFICYEVLDEK